MINRITKPASIASKLAGLVSLAPAGRRYNSERTFDVSIEILV